MRVLLIELIVNRGSLLAGYYKTILVTVKAAPHECVIRTGQP